MRNLLMFYLCLCINAVSLAQNQYNECSSAYFVNNANNWCSDSLQFNNHGATPSFNSYSACNDEIGNDIWLTFFGVASDAIIIITPESGKQISASLYDGDCNTLLEIVCGEQSPNKDFLWMYKGGLIQGHRYLLRIESKDVESVAFTVCINNYFSPANAGSDCATANLLCSKEGFAVKNVVGYGQVEELSGISCFTNTVESNSIWFKWKCEQSGDLTFELNPLNGLDDIDFVVYRVNGDEKSCDIVPVRCMATGVIPSQCVNNGHCCGKTGLRAGETDLEEAAGCSPARSNFLKPLDMIAGETYALAVNNYTSMNEAFEISFGGSGTFQTLNADFELDQKSGFCREDDILIREKSTNGVGNITNLSWSFSPDGVPGNANGSGDQTITFSTSGTKSISLIIENDSGCRSYFNDTINVLCCGGILSADIGRDTILEPGDSLLLDVTYILEGNNIQYSWFPVEIFNCPSCPPSATLPLYNDAIIKVRVEDEKGCEAEDQISVRIVGSNIFIPNIFSPNEDGINDIFTVYGSETTERVNFLKIFDRWGELIYEGKSLTPNDETTGWDGTFQNKPMKPDAYVYVIEVESKNKVKKLLKGSVTLVR